MKTIKKSVKVSKEAGMDPFVVEVVLDFTNTTEGQQMELMAASATIKWQAKARKLSDAELATMEETGVTVDVAGLFEKAARTIDPMKAAEKVTAEQAAELIKRLTEKFGL